MCILVSMYIYIYVHIMVHLCTDFFELNNRLYPTRRRPPNSKLTPAMPNSSRCVACVTGAPASRSETLRRGRGDFVIPGQVGLVRPKDGDWSRQKEIGVWPRTMGGWVTKTGEIHTHTGPEPTEYGFNEQTKAYEMNKLQQVLLLKSLNLPSY